MQASALSTTLAHDETTLTVLRFFTGLGLGGAMPNAVALTAEISPWRRRATRMMAMFRGFSPGAAVGVPIAAAIMGPEPPPSVPPPPASRSRWWPNTAADGREGYGAKLVLVRPDQFVAWAGDPPPDASAVLRHAAGQRYAGGIKIWLTTAERRQENAAAFSLPRRVRASAGKRRCPPRRRARPCCGP